MIKHYRALAFAALFGAALPRPQLAQAPGDPRVPETTDRMKLSGPRFGVTFLTTQMRDSLKSHSINVGPVISQFGWQFERQFLGNSEGVTAVSEWVFLVGGLDQGTFLPSISWLVGMRGPNGTEFGVGPNVSAAGASLVIAAGITHRAGALNVPINLAVVPSRDGTRIGLLTGFTMR